MGYLPQVEETFLENLIASEHEDLLRELEECGRTPAQARDLAVRRFYRSLCRHGEMESTLLFESLRATELGNRISDEAEMVESRLANRLPTVRDFTRCDEDWASVIDYTRRILSEHFRDEEEFLLPRAKHLIDKAEWTRIGLLYAFVETEGNGSRVAREGMGVSA